MPLDGLLIDLGQRLRLYAPRRQPMQELAQRGPTQVEIADRRHAEFMVSSLALAARIIPVVDEGFARI